MNNFLSLVKFECKKILLRKTTFICFITFICLVVIFTISALYMQKGDYWGDNISAFKAMEQEKQIVHSNAGYITTSMLDLAIQQNKEMLSEEDNYTMSEYGAFINNDAYITYSLPYKNIIDIVNVSYIDDLENISTDGKRVFLISNFEKPINKIEEINEQDFYQKLFQIMKKNVTQQEYLTDSIKNKNAQMISSIKTPYYNDYYGAYFAFFSFYKFLTLVLLSIIGIIISPVFASEYEKKTASIILSSKQGIKNLIAAKLFTGTFTSLILSLLVLGGFFIMQLVVFGAYGGNCPYQLFSAYSPYQLTMSQAVLILIAIATIINVMFSLLIMLVSTLSKVSFPVVIISFVLIFAPAIFHTNNNNILVYHIVNLFPAIAATVEGVFSVVLFDLFNNIVTPPTFYSIFYIVVSFVLVPIIIYRARSQQVSF